MTTINKHSKAYLTDRHRLIEEYKAIVPTYSDITIASIKSIDMGYLAVLSNLFTTYHRSINTLYSNKNRVIVNTAILRLSQDCNLENLKTILKDSFYQITDCNLDLD